MKHPFQLRDGRQFQLVKHPRFNAASDPATVASSPWGIRMTAPNGKRGWHSLHTADVKEALRRAKDLLDQAAAGSEAWTTMAEVNQRRAGQTVAPLVHDYLAAGCPRLRARALELRTGRSLVDERRNLENCLSWWGPRSITSIGPKLIDDYAAHRASAPRAAELELNALSNALKYAVRREKIAANPLEGRGAIRSTATIVHCHEEAPASTEELHRIVRHLLASRTTAPYGAVLMFCALTGLRPGEPGFLRTDAAAGQLGSRATLTADGVTFEIMHVKRLKHGINPAVRLHPAVQDFLSAWTTYARREWPHNPFWFPHTQQEMAPIVPAGDAQGSMLDKHLKAAAAAVGVTENRRPHAMRAYYVRVRRSMGALDSTIASELGERTGERLIVSTYGDPAGLRGDGKFTWLPSQGEPAWTVLAPAVQPANIVPLVAVG